METTEIANAFLSRAANTTKYMTSAQRVDSLTDLVLSYNSDKHDHMPELLLAKMAAATRRVSELAEEQQALLDKHGLAVEDVGELVEELKLLAVSLSTRDLRSDGSDLRNAIELVSDSLRVRQASVSRVASTPKQRAKLRRLVVADKKKLNKLLSRYQQTTGVLIDADACADGHFPWHEEYSAVGPLSLSEKRALCDVYMKRRRAQEERDIVKQEMERLLTYGSYVMDVLLQKLEDYQLIVLSHGAVMAGMVLHEEARGDDAGRLQRLDEPGAYAKPLRFQAYRLYMVWRCGRLGRGNRQPVPSCVVVNIRKKWPSPDGTYVGFKERTETL
ncbi:hypothetical protein FJT64_008120 [Amphibalanus amphitrite]|uniref:P2X purinoreceptor 7 intracellular domain-containing protein n=1 Tax=Amphibalanus amphitrite TaxID=1232801 RepID=A0A6A4VRJ1_AMPAM|nr:hypothetical protein FJT64_008120 [Amphibalanus amphitrite]